LERRAWRASASVVDGELDIVWVVLIFTSTSHLLRLYMFGYVDFVYLFLLFKARPSIHSPAKAMEKPVCDRHGEVERGMFTYLKKKRIEIVAMEKSIEALSMSDSSE